MTIEVFGNTQEVFNYALNQSSVTKDRIIITQNEFIEKLANPETIQALLKGLKQLTTTNQFSQLLENSEIDEAFKDPINPQFIKPFSQSLMEFFSSFDQVELRNYSFMNSMNSDTYSLIIRTSSNCIYESEHVEKYQIQQKLEELFRAYFYSVSTSLDIKELQFQIEIVKFEDVKKHFYLFKEGSKLELFALQSHPHPIHLAPYHVLGEQYSSFQEILFFNPATQNTQYQKEGVKMSFNSINVGEKLLEEQELIAIHNTTQQLNDVCIEGYLTMKGKVEISYLRNLMTPIENTYQNSLLLHKSTKKYNEISVLPIQELSTQTPNPKYILIRNIGEYKMLLESNEFEEVDGLIFTFSLFSMQLKALCKYLDIDCIISMKSYDKSLQTTIDWETLDIDCSTQSSGSNPFSQLLPQKSQEDIQEAQRMKMIQDELNQNVIEQKKAAEEQRVMQQQRVEQRPMTSSFKAQDTMRQSNPSEKKGALAMLADQVINTPEPISQSEPVVESTPEPIVERQVEETPIYREVIEEPIQKPIEQPPFERKEMFENRSFNDPISHPSSDVSKEALKEYIAFKQESFRKEMDLLKSIMDKLN